LVIVVSEETGDIRIAQRGVLSSPIDPNELEDVLNEELGHQPPPLESPGEHESVVGDRKSGFADDQEAATQTEVAPGESLMTSEVISEPGSEKGNPSS